MSYRRGDVLYGADPFKGEDDSRPWVVISNDSHPFHGAQYIVLGLTTKTWHNGLRSIDDDDWLDGGTPEPSSIIPWSVETLEHADVDFWQGRLARPLIDDCVDILVDYLQAD
jgi:mRNA-degrading endonuclease toxin of MazEF toxin-antitoxin module